MAFKVVERDVRDRLGEGPVWLPDRQRLLWVDIFGPAVNSLDLRTGTCSRIPMPEPVGWVLPRDSRTDFIAGLKSGFAVVDFDSGVTKHLGHPEADRSNNRFNDAKVDGRGCIWAGTKDDAEQSPGALYRLDPDLSWQRLDDGYGVTNGPTFSPDGKLLYHTDSAARTVYAFDLTERGELENKRLFLRFEDDWGHPDGMTTDREGCLWIAHWGGGRVSRFSPSAELIFSIDLPATNITSCTFAGDDLDRMFVTSSSIDCEGEPLAGALFEVEPGVQGLRPHSFAG